MENLLPTKELIQMIEERIPIGRILTTVALLVGLLAIIVSSCVYLSRAVIFPLVNLVSAGLTTGKVNTSVFSSFIASLIGTAAIYCMFEWTVRGSSRLMSELLDSSTSVLKHNSDVLQVAESTNQQLGEVLMTVQKLEARVDALEAE